MLSSHRMSRVRPNQRAHRARKGQELVEFTILITFFLIIFFCALQVMWTAIQKFHMNHYSLYAARVWSVCPCALGGTPPVSSASDKTLQINEALAMVKFHEWLKKGTGRTTTQADEFRRFYLWGAHSSLIPSDSSFSTLVWPSWATYANVVDGPVYFQPIPMIMPYSSLVMGGDVTFKISGLLPTGVQTIMTMLGITIPDFSLPLPKVRGFTVALGQTLIPMEQEPEENPDNNDNDGYWDSSLGKARQLKWTDIAGSI